MAMPTGPGDIFQAWALEFGLLLNDETVAEISLALMEDLESALEVISGTEDVDAYLSVIAAAKAGASASTQDWVRKVSQAKGKLKQQDWPQLPHHLRRHRVESH